MTQLIINTGKTPNDRNGDSLRSAFIKINTNFADLYTNLSQITFGSFEFHGSSLTTTDSTPVTINQSAEIKGNLIADASATVAGTLTVSSGHAIIGALNISNNTISTTDSSSIVISHPIIASSDLIVQGNLVLQSGANFIIPGPFADDAEASLSNVQKGSMYYNSTGQVHIKLT